MLKNKKNILIVAAENSAETHGAQILDRFNVGGAPVRFLGVGGDRFIQRGADVLIHNKELAVVGIIEVLAHLLKLKRIMDFLVKTALENKVDAALLIDYPDFNIRLAARLKKAGIPVYYFISPTVWAWRYGRVKLLRRFVSHMFIIFPFEIPIYEKEKIPFTYTGHPLVPHINTTLSREAFRQERRIAPDRFLIALLPGSRTSEVDFLLPVMLEAMTLARRELDPELMLLKADGIDDEHIRRLLAEWNLKVTVLPQSSGYNLIAASDAVITSCGTSNLEIAMLGTPFTAVYQVNKLSYFLGKPFVKINRYSIVNILARKEVIRELIQREFTPENVAAETLRLLRDQEAREAMKREFQALRAGLTLADSAADIIYDKISADLGFQACSR